MTSCISLVCQIIKAIDPKIKKRIDPSLVIFEQTGPVLDALFHDIEILEKIDPSHIDHLFQSYPLKDKKGLIEIGSKKISSKQSLFDFVSKKIKHELFLHYQTIPYKYMSAFENARILFLDGPRMQQLVGLLGVFDIKTFLKTSIDQKLILDIQNALTDFEKAFLKHILKDPERVGFKKMSLETWNKQRASFESMKYLRGLNRLSKALASHSPFIQSEIILRLPLKDKESFMTLATPSDDLLKKNLNEDLKTALDFLEAHINI